MRKMIVAIVVLALFTSVLGTVFGVAHDKEDSVLPSPLPFGPETSVFGFYALKTGTQERSCGPALQAIHNATGSGPNGGRPYATNNPKDPCANSELPSSGATEFQKAAPSFGTINIWFAPNFTAGTPLDTSRNIKGEFTLYFDSPAAGSPHIAAAKPTVRLTVAGEEIGSWVSDVDLVDELQGPGSGFFYQRFAFDFGPAPETLPAGHMRLHINLENSAQNQRTIGLRVGLAVDEANKGFMELPFTEASRAFGPGAEDGADGDDSQNGNETNGNETGNETANGDQNGNETYNGHGLNETHNGHGNNTTIPSDKGFLPGFEIVAVVSASLIALALVSRHRRPVRPVGVV